MKFVGISGPIASGKSTLAQGLSALCDLQELNSVVMSFAAGVKYLGALYNMPDAQAKAYEYFRRLGYAQELSMDAAKGLALAFDMYPVQEGIKPRRLLQYIGTELGRQAVDEWIWITALKKEARALLPKPYAVFIDDVRFLNESHMVDVLVRIEVTDKDLYASRVNKLPAEYIQNNHPSEQQQMRIPDVLIPIDYTAVQLVHCYKSIKALLRQM